VKILMTGHLGYIGSVMSPYLRSQGHEIVGLDTGYFEECNLGDPGAIASSIRKDLRDIVPSDLKGFDAVIHLGALSNDPIGNLNESWTQDINHHGSVRLAELSGEAGIRRFLFSSSCIMYGSAAAEVVTEDSPLDPKTEYARSKVKAEMDIRELATDDFSPTYLRNGTVYGYSPNMRFDTVLNNLVGAALTTGKIILFSDGQPWRPVVNIQDLARSFETVLTAPLWSVHNEAFNNGANHLNKRIIELAEFVEEAIPGSKLEIRAEAGADQRTYRADFTKFKDTFPDFEFKWHAKEGAKSLADQLTEFGLTYEQFSGPSYTRLPWLNSLIDSGRLDSDLRWTEAGVN